MSPRTLPSPDAPSEVGEHAGRPYWLWLPRAEPPWPGMLIIHGAGSAKENHGDFGRLCASAGWAALSYDQRGHGESADAMSPQALTDVGRMARFLGGHAGVDERRVCVRGSSMGGFMAIHGAATSDSVAAAIAICPAWEDHLLRMLGNGEAEFRVDEDAFAAWLGELDLADAAELMGRKPLIILHADGDERIPSDLSAQLGERKPMPCKLVIVPGGHHRSVQHDPELQGIALSWVAKQL